MYKEYSHKEHKKKNLFYIYDLIIILNKQKIQIIN